MPFTPSHVAAALPFLRTPLMPAALVIGSMAPDVPYFVPLGVPRDLTHSLIGVPTADLVITLALFAAWYAVLRAPVIDLAPSRIRERMPRRGTSGWRPRDRDGRTRGWGVSLVLVVASALVGIVTHLVWDAFTHRDSPLVLAWPALQARLGPFAVSTWLQHLSTVAGLAIVGAWVVRWIRRTPVDAGSGAGAPSAQRVAAWVAVIVAFVGTGLVIWLFGIARGLNPFDGDLMFGVATRAGAAALLVVALITVAWWIGRRRARTTRS